MAIPSGSTAFKTKGSLGEVEDIEMTIDEKGFKFLMSILTNLYERPVLAVIREYCTNAVDAHIEAGYDGPVEVTMPTYDKPKFIVRDYGPGMDLEDIRNTYSKYVASTKRQDNTQAGMFGIGAKSALALGDTFTVTSVKNGRKIIVAVLRKARGEASMKIMAHNEPTSDKNGTTITVPADNPRKFEQEANTFFPYVKKGLFLVDGKDKGGTFEGVKVNDDLYALPQDYYNSTSIIVMGNVPYTVEMQGERRRVVKYVEPGTFEPTPPREGLEQTPGFMDRIKGYLDDAAAGVAQSVTDAIKGMDPADAAQYVIGKEDILSKWNALDKVEYGNRKFGDDFKYNTYGCVRVMGSSSFDASGTCKFGDYFLGGHVVETDFKSAKDMNTYTTQKATGARVLVGYPRTMFVYTKGKTPAYAAKSRTIAWDKCKTVNTYGNTRTNYGASVDKAGDDWKVPTRKVYYDRDKTPTFPSSSTKVVPYGDYKGDDDKRDLVYFSPTELTNMTVINLYNALYTDEDVFLVIKYTNQHAKTKRTNPEAIHINDYGKRLAQRLFKKHGQEAFLSLSMPHKWDKLKGDLFDKVRAIKAKQTNPKDLDSNQRTMVRTFLADSLTIEQEFATLVESVKDRYPLLDSTSWSTDLAHLNQYVAAIDAYKEA